MDEPFHEETYEDLITPSFFSLERDTLHMVEVTQALSRSHVDKVEQQLRL